VIPLYTDLPDNSRVSWHKQVAGLHSLVGSTKVTESHKHTLCYAWWTHQDVWQIINQVCTRNPRDLGLKYDKTDGALHSLGIHLSLPLYETVSFHCSLKIYPDTFCGFSWDCIPVFILRLN